MLKTTNGGLNWNNSPAPGGISNINELLFRNINTGYMIDVTGKIHITLNGGESWTQQNSPANDQLFDIFFTDDNTGYAVGNTGTVLKTIDGALPVTLSSFNATAFKNNVKLSWLTETEVNNSGFDVERKTLEETGGWRKLGFVHGNGNSNITKSYFFEDNELRTGKYQYRLKQIDYNGNYEYFNLPNVVSIEPPMNFSIKQNYPNPSNPKSRIDFELPNDSKVTLKVYDLLGREVKTLADEFRKADYYTIEFDGSNLASGVYFYTLRAGNFTAVKKLVLVK
jgi:hypothetical protein